MLITGNGVLEEQAAGGLAPRHLGTLPPVPLRAPHPSLGLRQDVFQLYRRQDRHIS